MLGAHFFLVRTTATCATFEIFAPPRYRAVISAKLSAPLRHILGGKFAPLNNSAFETYFSKHTRPCTCLTYPVSCVLFHLSCLMHPVSRILSHASCLTYPVSHILSHVSSLTYPSSCILSHVSCLMYLVSHVLSHVCCLVSPV